MAIGLIAAAAATAIALVLTLGRHDTTSARASKSRTQTAVASSAIALADARALVVHYLDDVNAQNRGDAQSLICSTLVDSWHTTIDQPGGDFTVRVTKATFTKYRATTDGIQLDYTLDVTPLSTPTPTTSGASPATSTVTFTVVRELGALRICGES